MCKKVKQQGIKFLKVKQLKIKLGEYIDKSRNCRDYEVYKNVFRLNTDVFDDSCFLIKYVEYIKRC